MTDQQSFAPTLQWRPFEAFGPPICHSGDHLDGGGFKASKDLAVTLIKQLSQNTQWIYFISFLFRANYTVLFAVWRVANYIWWQEKTIKRRKKKEPTPSRNAFHTADKLQAVILFHCNPGMNMDNFWYDPALGLSF